MGGYENDRAFEAVLQNTGQNIEQFVDEFFSFLARRSDFFVVTPPEGGAIGFPPGVAAKLVISKFKKWEEFQSRKKKGKAPPIPVARIEPEAEVPPVVRELVVPYESGAEDSSGKIKKLDGAKNGDGKETPSVGTVEKDAKKTEPVKKTKEKEKQNPIDLCDTYNGRKTDKYSWSQSIKELDIHIAVGPDVKTKKQVKVEIHMNKIRVVTGTSSENEVVTDWQLSHPIVKDESYWSLHPGESIFLSLQKVREMWWDHLFEGEEKLDRSQIDAVKPMEDLEDEEQAKIQELVWNQEQKLKGLPTSEDMKMEEVMKQAWDAEGSPFKGEPFDMSRIQMASNTITAVTFPEGK